MHLDFECQNGMCIFLWTLLVRFEHGRAYYFLETASTVVQHSWINALILNSSLNLHTTTTTSVFLSIGEQSDHQPEVRTTARAKAAATHSITQS